jgi:NitT/TauT family transport system substrate-binding protein
VRLAEVPANSTSLRALAARMAQGAALTLDEVLRARAEGMSLGVVLVFDVSAGADMLLARPPIATLDRLAGATIGVAQETNGALLLAAALRAAELTPAQVRPLDLTYDDQEAAWSAGQVDALVTYGAVAERLLAQGAQRLFDTRRAPDTILDVLALRTEVLDDPAYAEGIHALIAAHFRALELWQRQPAAETPEMAAHLGLAPAAVARAFQGLKLPDLAENRRLLGGPRPALLGGAETLVAAMTTMGILTGAVDLGGLVTDRFLPEEAPR